MTLPSMNDLQKLAEWDTPTICNALEFAAPSRRGFGFSVFPFSVLYPDMKPIVGFARTAKIRASHPDTGGEESIERINYYEYIASGTMPTITVIEDVDPSPGVGAYWGEVNTALHKGLGSLGVITNGSYRDIPDTAPNFQILGGMVGPSHAYVHPTAIDCDVSVHGMDVKHNDLIHADQHGAVVVPLAAVAKIPEAVELIVKREGRLLKAARADDFSIEKLKTAFADMDEIH